MDFTDASGRKISILNEDAPPATYYHERTRPSYPTHRYSSQYARPRSPSSGPNTPELLRSDSYDSHASNDPVSPLTPSLYDPCSAHEGYPRYKDYTAGAHGRAAPYPSKRPSSFADSRSVSYDDDAGGSSSSPSSCMAPADRPVKRYPCRYRDSHRCEKTFTTSGHASRHSKIHSAEKAVQCTHPGCSKKFTRADNMKQHRETHNKDKSRPPASRPSGTGRRHSSSARSSSSSGSAGKRPPLLVSPVGGGSLWDLSSIAVPALGSRPAAVRTPSSGLDALAMAVACQGHEV